LPRRGTRQKDYWGYINTNTGTLTPPTTVRRLSQTINPGATIIVGDGDRTANENKMKSGILQKITYPEGGYSVFEFETNKYTENITTPTIVYKNASAAAYGIGCAFGERPGFVSTTFTTNNYVYGSGQININFMPATQESGQVANVTFDNQTYYRPLPFSVGGQMSIQKDISGTHTLTASEYRSGNIGANGCPITSISATWQETSGSTTTLVTKLVGGLRIKSIANYDGKNSSAVAVKRFQYEEENVLIKEGNGTYVRGMFEADNLSDVIPILSTSAVFDNNTGGSPAITYGKITEFDTNIDNSKQNGKTEYLYQNIMSSRLFDISGTSLPTVFKSPFYNTAHGVNIEVPLTYLDKFAFYKNDLWNHGSLLKTNTYKTGLTPNSYVKIKTIENTYTILKQSSLPYNVVFNNFPSQAIPGDYPHSFYLPYNQEIDFYSGHFYYSVGQTSQGKKVLTTTIETDYDSNEAPTTVKTTTYGYQNPLHNQVTKTEITNSKAETLRTQLSYPQDQVTTGQVTEMQKLITQNKIDKPVKTETFVNNVQTSESMTKYEESTATGGALLPKEIHTSKGTVETFPFTAANRKINFTLYDTDVVNGVTVGNANVLEYSLENGTPVSIIWGYNKTQPIAKIENATYSQVISYVTNLQNISNTGTETDLIAALNSLRTSLPNAMVTTYTYKLLIGVSTITDPKGDTITYSYDTAGRLEFVKDAQGNLLSQNQYRYKNQ
jgi:YD repeat-containing protein